MNTYRIKITTSKGDKVGKIYGIRGFDSAGRSIEGVLLWREKEPTFKTLSKKLRKSGLIPTSVVLKKKGETFFEK